jgi:hypothetical protein
MKNIEKYKRTLQKVLGKYKTESREVRVGAQNIILQLVAE